MSKSAFKAVKKLCADINVPSLSDVGASRSKVIELAPKMAKNGIASESPANNPKKATKDDMVRLHQKKPLKSVNLKLLDNYNPSLMSIAATGISPADQDLGQLSSYQIIACIFLAVKYKPK